MDVINSKNMRKCTYTLYISVLNYYEAKSLLTSGTRQADRTGID